jgi:hypothetical protein
MELMKVNPDGPSLTLTVGFSASESSTTIPIHDNSIDIPQNQGNSFTTVCSNGC